jgi:hypothetical protein
MLKILFSIFLICWFAKPSFSQGLDIVTIKTLGQGKTVQDATTQALREAISQAYGVFISANTTIVNDSLLKDEIVSLTTGNIQKYSILSQTEVLGIGYSVFVNADVSLNKLSSFAQSKGSEATFDGGGFAMNIKLQKLNEQAELIATANLLSQVWQFINSSISYSLKLNQPILNKTNSEDYIVNTEIESKIPDSVQVYIIKFLLEGLKNISLTNEERLAYNNLGKKMFELVISDNELLNFRNSQTINIISAFCFKIQNVYCGFQLSNNLEQDINIKYDIQPGQMSFQLISGKSIQDFKTNSYQSFLSLRKKYNRSYISAFSVTSSDTITSFLTDLSEFTLEDLNKFMCMVKSTQKWYDLSYQKQREDPMISQSESYQYFLGSLANLLSEFNSSMADNSDRKYFFHGFYPVHFNVSFHYSLIQLEQLKDFKVNKITN